MVVFDELTYIFIVCVCIKTRARFLLLLLLPTCRVGKKRMISLSRHSFHAQFHALIL